MGVKGEWECSPHQSLCPLQDAEIPSPTEIKKQATFDALIERRWGTLIQAPKENSNHNLNKDKPARLVPEIKDSVDVN